MKYYSIPNSFARSGQFRRISRSSSFTLLSSNSFKRLSDCSVGPVVGWQEVVIHHPDGSYSVDDLTTEKVTDRVDRLRHKTEFYKLIARSDGYFECPLCPPEATRNGRFFLYFRELYKYGITIDPAKRYSQAELAKWNLDYVVIAVGSYSEMLVLETTHMGSYPILPENLRRPLPRRLVTPAGSGAKLR